MGPRVVPVAGNLGANVPVGTSQSRPMEPHFLRLVLYFMIIGRTDAFTAV